MIPTHDYGRAMIRTAATAVLAMALVGAGAGVLHDDQGNALQFYGGTIRSTAAGWVIVDDAAHEPLNLASVSCDAVSGQVTVMLSSAGSQVVSSFADGDETLSRADIVAGVSAGLDRLVIRYSRAGVAVPCTSALLQGSTANTWIGGINLPASA